MAKSNSRSDNEVYDDSYYSKSCRKNIENLNTKISKLNEELSDCENDLYHYKIGLSQVEARLVKFKTQEIKFSEKIRGLERDVEVRNNKIEYLTNELEDAKKEKESLDNKLTVPPPPAQVYSPPKKDLSWTGLPEFVDDTVTDYSSIMTKPMIKFVKAADCPKVTKTNNIENARKSTYTCKQKRQLNDKKKEKPMWNNAGRVNHQNSPRITHPNLKRHMGPRKILTISGPISFNTVRQSHLNVVCYCCSRQVNTARPKAVINVVRTNRVNDVKASAC
nr:hypothetical protein [Tanacetum cinerariifolium]